jgi:polyhydroxyalkanoate synthesis regulator phasin
MTTKKKKAVTVPLSKRLADLQKNAEKQARKGWERTLGMLPPAQRKSVKRLTADVDKARNDFLKRSEKALKDLRKRTDRLGADVEKRIEGAFGPLTKRLEKRLDVATRADVARLRKRIDQLERRLETRSAPTAAV